MRGLILVLGLLAASYQGAAADPSVDFAKVFVEKRHGVDWCVLEAQVSGTVAAPLERLRTVIENYEAYPRLFPRIREVQVAWGDEAVLLTEKVVVEAMGIVNTNRFTLRIKTTRPSPQTFQSAWTQETTDGTIDSLEGRWTLENLGTTQKPLVRVVYLTRSAVPIRIPGQDVVIGMFLGGETKGVVDTVFKEALGR